MGSFEQATRGVPKTFIGIIAGADARKRLEKLVIDFFESKL
jgi:hypothetical protein